MDPITQRKKGHQSERVRFRQKPFLHWTLHTLDERNEAGKSNELDWFANWYQTCLCAPIFQRKCCEVSTREFSETIGTCSAVLNHFQSQRPFPSVNRQSSKVVWWGGNRWGVVAVCGVSEAPCIGSPHEDFFFAFLSECSKRNKTGLRCTQSMREVPCTAKQTPVLSCFFFLFFSKNHHLLPAPAP